MREFIHGDCMKYLPNFPDNYFDIAIVDPPYGIKEHGGKNRSKYVKQKNGSSIYVPDGGYKNFGEECFRGNQLLKELFNKEIRN
jgi:site-specific DNA-methyltransferase (adenine-specific)